MENKKLLKHRLKQKDLVSGVFRLFADQYENSTAKSIFDIQLPIEQIKDFLKERYEASYRSNLWIYTQLKRYEEEAGIKLFKKVKKGKDYQNFNLSIHDHMITFSQKQHLYVTGKLKVANGVFEKIKNKLTTHPVQHPVRILLGAGSTIYHLAEIIADYSQQSRHQLAIYTHNLGVIQRLLSPDVDAEKVKLFTSEGRIDPVTFCIVTKDANFYEAVRFDYIIQGTSSVYNGELFIESEEESVMKEAILHRCSGEKILVLTKNEFIDQPVANKSFGKITDYDYLVIPRFQKDNNHKKDYETEFDRYRKFFEPFIINWNYEILRINSVQPS